MMEIWTLQKNLKLITQLRFGKEFLTNKNLENLGRRCVCCRSFCYSCLFRRVLKDFEQNYWQCFETEIQGFIWHGAQIIHVVFERLVHVFNRHTFESCVSKIGIHFRRASNINIISNWRVGLARVSVFDGFENLQQTILFDFEPLGHAPQLQMCLVGCSHMATYYPIVCVVSQSTLRQFSSSRNGKYI